MICAVIFDIDDTLYDQMQPFSAACGQFPSLKNVDLLRLYQARSVRGMEALQWMDEGKFTLQENHIYRIQMACQDLGVPISEEEALRFQEAYAAEQQRLTVTAGMRTILDGCLKHSLFLGILTNGPSDHQRKKARILGLERWFSPAHLIASGDCGWLKPDPRIFHLAEKQWGLDPETTLYVGDSYEHDILGAQQAGWKSFWLQRRPSESGKNPAAPTAAGGETDLLHFLF